MSTIIVTNPDVDGALAASVLLAGIRTEWATPSVEFANYQDLEDKLQMVLRDRNVNELYLVDLDAEEIAERTLDGLLTNTRLHVVDHHGLSSALARRIEGSGGNCWAGEGVCSTELAIRAIGETAGGRLELVAGAARADDFNDETVSETARRLARDLGGALMPGADIPPEAVVRRVVAELREGLLRVMPTKFALSSDLERWLHNAAEAIEARQPAARKALQIDSLHVRSHYFGQLSVACARVPDILFGKPGVEAIQSRRLETDIAVALFDDGACWVFPHGFPRSHLDLVPLLKALGGGGRNGGGGFGFKGRTDEQNYRARLDGFVTVIRAYGDEPEFSAALRAIPPLRRRATERTRPPN